MKLSIIIPAYNEAAHIVDAVDAARAAAEHAGEPFEIIVVNDDSADNTAALAERAGARVLHVHKRQIAAVRNAGAAAASGNVLVFIDGDSQPSSDLLRSVVAAIRRGAAAGGARVAYDREGSVFSKAAVEVWNFIGRVMDWAAGSFIFARREAFEGAGGFDERFFAAEEIVLSERLKRQGRFVVLSEPVVTSSRKERTHSPMVYFLTLSRVILSAGRALQRRDGLAIWYDGKR
jgi:glycosyltransferase involved in cell wall biosynthesis